MGKKKDEGRSLFSIIGGCLFVFLIWVLFSMAEGRTFMQGVGDQLYAIGALAILGVAGYIVLLIMDS